jgi:hypothetical protein
MGEWSLHNLWPSDSAPSELDWFHGYDVVGHRLRAGGQRAVRRCRDASQPPASAKRSLPVIALGER